MAKNGLLEVSCSFPDNEVHTILFEIITFLIRKPLNHVTVIAEKY